MVCFKRGCSVSCYVGYAVPQNREHVNVCSGSISAVRLEPDVGYSGRDRLNPRSGIFPSQSAAFLLQRTASDRALAEARGQAAKLAAQLQVVTEREADVRQRLDQAESTVQAQRDAQTAALQAVTAELAEIRKYAMRSIDDVRGETRAERERRVQLEELLKRNERLMEVFRQVAYQRGGSIPPELRMEQPR